MRESQKQLDPYLRTQTLSVIVPLTWVAWASSAARAPLAELNTHTWPRRRGSWRRMEGKMEQVQVWLLAYANEMSQQESNDV